MMELEEEKENELNEVGEEEGGEKLFIIQQQEKLWAIKKDWIWLKSLLLSVYRVCLVDAKEKLFPSPKNPKNFPHTSKGRAGKLAGIYPSTKENRLMKMNVNLVPESA